MSGNEKLQRLTREWFLESFRQKYSYQFTWLGRPIIQYPQDIVAMQELIWRIRPDLVIETGVAHGGSLVFYASMMQLLGGNGRVVGIDVEIRPPNRAALEAHPLFDRISLIEGSSIDPAVVARVAEIAAGRKVVVTLDSNHTHDHVLRELELYSPLVRAGSYLVVFDTRIEDIPDELCQNRPWRSGNSPMTAVRAFLAANDRFEIDRDIEHRLLITVAPDGYLRCVRD
jgi:cephalosporin hydroxylase